jgi:hypothetical protein
VDETRGPDERLLAALRGLLDRSAPLPARLVEMAKESYTWRTVDAELAALTSDSLVDPPVGSVRGAAAPRSLTFEAGDLSIEVEVAELGPDRRMLGQLIPPQPARIEVRQDDLTRTVEADVVGRFVVEGLSARPVRLRCHLQGRRPVVTEWVIV